MNNFIELSIVFDSADNLIAARKALIRADLITSVIDASRENNSHGAVTKIGLTDAMDYVNDDDDVGGVVRMNRTLYVEDSYDAVAHKLEEALRKPLPAASPSAATTTAPVSRTKAKLPPMRMAEND